MREIYNCFVYKTFIGKNVETYFALSYSRFSVFRPPDPELDCFYQHFQKPSLLTNTSKIATAISPKPVHAVRAAKASLIYIERVLLSAKMRGYKILLYYRNRFDGRFCFSIDLDLLDQN